MRIGASIVAAVGKRRSRPWAASAGLALAIGLSGAGVQKAAAAPVDPSSVASYSIPEQDLDGAVLAFGRMSGIRVFNESGKMQGRRGNAVSGTLSAEKALGRLLEGTGLHFVFTRGAVRIFELLPTATSTETATELREINVEGQGGNRAAETATSPLVGFVARRSATATKTDTALIETPRSISVVGAEEVKTRGGAQNINDVLAYTPGFFTTATNDSRQNGVFKLRGFSIYESLYLDGLALPTGKDRVQPQIEPFGIERFEALKGPASVLYGQGEPGGMLNMVSKRPVFDDPIREVRAQTGSFDRYQGTIDFSDKIDQDGRLAYRLTALAQKSGTQIDHQDDNRFFVAPSLTWRPDEDTSLTLLTHYRRATGGDFFNGLPRGIIDQLPRSRFVGEPGFDRNKLDQFALGYEFSHRFDDAFKVFSSARYLQADSDYRGLYEADSTFNPDKPGEYYRSVYLLDETARAWNFDNRAQFNFEAGPFTSQLVAGVDYRRQRATNRNGFFWQGGPSLDFLDPEYGSPVTGVGFTDAASKRLEQVGVYAQEQLKFDKFVLSFGGRQDWARASVDSHPIGTAPDPTKVRDSAFTGNIGLLYLFDSGFAPYISYSTSFKPLAEMNSDGTPFKPTTGKQYEAGLKYQPSGTNLLMQASVFELTKQNVVTDDPNSRDPEFRKQTGEIRSRGFEFETKASTGGLNLTASYTYLDPVITKSGDGDQGLRPAEMPKHQASLWADYHFRSGPIGGLNVGGGVRYVGSFIGSRFGENLDQTTRMKPVTFFDASVGYDFGVNSPKLKGLRLDLNVINVADKRHLDFCDEYSCYFARRRTALVTMSYKW